MVVQDLAKFFDILQLEHVIVLALRPSAPPQLVPLLKSSCENSKHLFTCRGVCSMPRLHATGGVLQGSPLSPALAALVMTIWRRFDLPVSMTLMLRFALTIAHASMLVKQGQCGCMSFNRPTTGV